MQSFHYKNNELYAENVAIRTITSKFGTPCYIYSRAQIEKNWHEFNDVFGSEPHRICYAVKANSNLAILNILAKLGSGFDIVSGGELERVLAAGGDPAKIVFSGVGKTDSEILRALEVGIFCFNVESEAELEKINQLAEKQNKIAPISLRVNPDIDARTHPYIATGLKENKFGIELSDVMPLCQKIKSLNNIKLISIGCHIGSQLTELDPFLEALDCLLDLIQKLKSAQLDLHYLNLGGGLGIAYRDETPPAISDYISAIRNKLAPSKLELILEPGRIIVANAGILVTKVEYLKHNDHKNFAIVDAGMNDLIRPVLYDAWHNIIPVSEKNGNKTHYDIVGPVCESADFFGKDRELALETGDLLAIMSSGAYGFSMSSNYNSRPRPSEVIVNGDQTHLIRKREKVDDLFALEQIIK